MLSYVKCWSLGHVEQLLFLCILKYHAVISQPLGHAEQLFCFQCRRPLAFLQNDLVIYSVNPGRAPSITSRVQSKHWQRCCVLDFWCGANYTVIGSNTDTAGQWTWQKQGPGLASVTARMTRMQLRLVTLVTLSAPFVNSAVSPYCRTCWNSALLGEV